MIEFFQAGGWAMFLLLFTAIGGAVGAVAQRARAAGILTATIHLLLIEGLFGLATNLTAVSQNYARFPDPLEALGMGIGEAATTGTFAAGLALLFGVARVGLALRAPVGRAGA